MLIRRSTLLLILALALGVPSVSSCSRKTGCPASDAAHVKMDRRGQLPTKGGSSQLFSKDMRKKMKKRGR